ncbi:NAD(P)H-dependent oxidoreductase [Paenibacillus glycanilyticus]|uniref:NADPH-dependent FMN reductase n=1 Tax=Paenibacillus glycanilyticus TaxID=126569 RepID=UPI00203D9571|nr:NADPH-dependent FMN reductase [Paenibacillus glycanilyticus]MCM3627054.1 NAD(P)H-dependent oxidoreductase [Paenibacillus glycanilyticus]
MKLLGLSGSNIGSKTRVAMNNAIRMAGEIDADVNVSMIDLADYDIPYGDGRNYLDYKGDALHVAKLVMDADAILIGTPIFQASIPAILKNVFDLLPPDALRGKTIGIIVTAGTSKHFLMAEHQLKPILAFMKANIISSYVFIENKDYNPDKELVNPDILDRLNRLAKETIDTHKALYPTT